MFASCEQTALEARLTFCPCALDQALWTAHDDHPYISRFTYRVVDQSDEGPDIELGEVSGYRISHDWATDSEILLWQQADALDGDVVRYVDALIRELRGFRVLEPLGPDLPMFQRTTMVRHVASKDEERDRWLWQAVVASLVVMDAPRLMLVDPGVMPNERTPQGKLDARGRAKELMRLGLKRMVGSPYLWAWDREHDDLMMQAYDGDALVEALRDGRLAGTIDRNVYKDIYGELDESFAHMFDLPSLDDFDE